MFKILDNFISVVVLLIAAINFFDPFLSYSSGLIASFAAGASLVQLMNFFEEND